MGLIFVGVGRERFENSLPCHPLIQSLLQDFDAFEEHQFL